MSGVSVVAGKEEIASGAQAADFVRDLALKDGDALTDYPVDPYRLATGYGIDVYVAALPAGVSGVIRSSNSGVRQIYIDAAESPTRQRFTMAHELGHFVYHSLRNPGQTLDYVEKRNGMSTPEEVWANDFAASLLMPKEDVQEQAQRPGASVAQLAARYGVSQRAIRERLGRLQLWPLTPRV